MAAGWARPLSIPENQFILCASEGVLETCRPWRLALLASKGRREKNGWRG